MLATNYLARVTEYGWDESGDAYVKMTLDVNEVAEILGEPIAGEKGLIVVEGAGAQIDDFAEAKLQ